MGRYSFNRRDKKIAGVCSSFGEIFAIDPTFLRIGLAAVALMISWQIAVLAYIAGGIYLHRAKRKAMKQHLGWGASDIDRMDEMTRPGRTSVHDLRTKLDANDRRMMAIDHHLNAARNDELAREIEKLREGK